MFREGMAFPKRTGTTQGPEFAGHAFKTTLFRVGHVRFVDYVKARHVPIAFLHTIEKRFGT